MKSNIFIIAAPSGAGKSSFVARIIKEIPVLEDTISFTTRKIRAGEKEGDPYHFVSLERFETLVEQGFFVEWAKVHENYYGTPEHQIREITGRGHAVIMDVDVKGADTFKRKFPKSVRIFIVPPSIDELRRRIVKRDGKVPADIDVRMQNAVEEIKRAPEYDFQIVNRDFEESYAEFKKIVEGLID